MPTDKKLKALRPTNKIVGDINKNVKTYLRKLKKNNYGLMLVNSIHNDQQFIKTCEKATQRKNSSAFSYKRRFYIIDSTNISQENIIDYYQLSLSKILKKQKKLNRIRAFIFIILTIIFAAISYFSYNLISSDILDDYPVFIAELFGVAVILLAIICTKLIGVIFANFFLRENIFAKKKYSNISISEYLSKLKTRSNICFVGLYSENDDSKYYNELISEIESAKRNDINIIIHTDIKSALQFDNKLDLSIYTDQFDAPMLDGERFKTDFKKFLKKELHLNVSDKIKNDILEYLPDNESYNKFINAVIYNHPNRLDSSIEEKYLVIFDGILRSKYQYNDTKKTLHRKLKFPKRLNNNSNVIAQHVKEFISEGDINSNNIKLHEYFFRPNLTVLEKQS